jgi:hypothetical protein
MATTDPRITKAKRLIAAATVTAAEIKTDGSLNRSTATRAIYKTKAEALDAVAEVLAAKPKKK